MPTLGDLLDELRKAGVLVSEVALPRKVIRTILDKAAELTEEDEEED